MTICRKCGTSNRDNKKFCVFCHELLVADPVELEKRAAAEQKKQQRIQKKLNAKYRRWKKALFMLIPIGVLDLLDLLLCLDLAFIGIGSMLGEAIGDVIADYIGTTIRLFGNLVYTNQTVAFAVRGLELLGALGILLIACVLCVIMIVRMIKWRAYLKRGETQQASVGYTEYAPQSADAQELPVEEQSVEQVKTAMGEQGVSYAALSQLEEQYRANAAPTPASETSCGELFATLKPHLWEYDEDSVRRILSSVCASRLLLCSAGALDSAGIFDQLSRAFGCNAEQFVCPEGESTSTDSIARILLQTDKESGALVHTSFAKSLYAARFSPKRICLAGVGGIGAKDADAVFAPLTSYFGVPEGNVALYLGQPDAKTRLPDGIDEGKLVLPANLWVVDVLPEQDHIPCASGETARYAAALYLRNSGKAFPPEDAQQAQAVNVSVDALERAVAAAENDCYLSDELWSVIDLIEQKITEVGGTRLSNRTLRMFEKYTAVFLATGGKMHDAFDNGFASVILPACAAQLRAVAEKSEGETLSAMLERTVGRERLPMTVEVLTSMELI